MLVLDEATSALDNVTERQFMGTVESLSGELTIIMVAHRLSTVRSADHLIFLERGRVAAEGTFEQLRDRSPAFARLVELSDLD